MSFGEAIKSVFRQYATFSGRARRSEYWWFYLFTQLIAIPFAIVLYILFFVAFVPVWTQADAEGVIPDSAWEDFSWAPIIIAIVLMVLLFAFFFLPSWAVTWRRLHDMGQPGAWALLGLIGLGIVPLIMCIMDTEAGTNRWGPDPKAGERPQMPPPNYGSAPGYGQPQPPAAPPAP